MQKHVRVQKEYENKVLRLPEMNNEMVIFNKTHYPRVEELERKVNELMTWKEDALRVYLKSKRP